MKHADAGRGLDGQSRWRGSVFAMPTGERQFVRRMENVDWAHCLTVHLA